MFWLWYYFQGARTAGSDHETVLEDIWHALSAWIDRIRKVLLCFLNQNYQFFPVGHRGEKGTPIFLLKHFAVGFLLYSHIASALSRWPDKGTNAATAAALVIVPPGLNLHILLGLDLHLPHYGAHFLSAMPCAIEQFLVECWWTHVQHDLPVRVIEYTLYCGWRSYYNFEVMFQGLQIRMMPWKKWSRARYWYWKKHKW